MRYHSIAILTVMLSACDKQPPAKPVAVETTPASTAAPARKPSAPAVQAEPKPRIVEPEPVAVVAAPMPPTFDKTSAQRAGLRTVESERLTLCTDLPPSEAIDALPSAFDLAWPQWCEYFNRPEQRTAAHRMTAFLMLDRERFRRAGFLPGRLPDFRNGFSWDDDLWLVEQPTEYYRRHLLLHEGTHAFMNTVLGGCGPAWYMEGVAELLATHRLTDGNSDGKLTLNTIPSSKNDVPQLGRIKLVRDAVAAGRLLSIDTIMAFEPQTQLENEAYAWSWALAALLDGAPQYRLRFRAQQADVTQHDFNERFRERFATDWDKLSDDWQVFATTLTHGHDLERSAIDFGSGETRPAKDAKVEVAVDRGWQSTGVRLEAGKKYRLHATGRYQIVAGPPAWESEADGVSMRYEGGHLLGALLAVVRPDEPTSPSAFLTPTVIGSHGELLTERSGTLYLRVNDSPAELADNLGTLSVTIEEE
jgi:hypothetical protein